MGAIKEHYHGRIEHESRFNQGRKNRYEKAAWIYFWVCMAILVFAIIWVALGIDGA